MVSKTRKAKKLSKRVLDPMTVWGKNPSLERFWGNLASGKDLVLIYKDNTHKYVHPPKRFTKKHETMMNEIEEDADIVAILSSNLSQDAYEVYLYPKAKNNSVEHVIKNYKKFFKPIAPGTKLRVPL